MAGSFSLDISRFVAKANGRLDLVVRKISLDMFSRVILRSPVGNPDLWKSKPPPGYVGGTFRGNWQVEIGAVPAGFDVDVKDKSGAATISAMTAKAMGVKAGDIVYLANNLPYARALEYGWSKQAAEGMVRVTILEFGAIVSQSVEATKREMP